jgi:16S rRNA (guanine966-N2)-methyltransferase
MKPGVRITGGIYRGRSLDVPRTARPTEGRVREALFSIWRERITDGDCRFLDLFAGSGAVGLEAASRGALQVLFVDDSVDAVRTVAANAARLGESVVEVRRLLLPAGLDRLAAEPAGPFDLVFADPPYRFAAYDALLIATAPLLAEGGEIAVEHSSRREMPDEVAGLVRTGVRRYGESALSLYRAAPL